MKGDKNMRFSFDESELINSFFEDIDELPNKDFVIKTLDTAKNNTEDPELVLIANNTIDKIKKLDDTTFKAIFENIPINSYVTY